MPKEKPVRNLIIVMLVVVSAAVVVIYGYYSEMNSRNDPRIVPARSLYAGYNKLAGQDDLVAVLNLLDSVEKCYLSVPYYRNEYEPGVLMNNRAAVYLTLALHRDSLQRYYGPLSSMERDSLLMLAERAVDSSISIYKAWMLRNDTKTEEEITTITRQSFLTGLEPHTEKEQEKFLKNRVKEIMTARAEIPRRLSVAYTNKGIICRQKAEYQQALEHYRHALELWKDNLTAENNINILLGRPLKKRNFLQKLFPAER